MSRRWETLVNNYLLKNGVITGISIISQNASCLYSTGKLQKISESSTRQFASLFSNISEQQLANLFQRGLSLSMGRNEETVTFHIYKKTNCSLYATAAHTKQGLLVGNIPCGVVVCTYSPPSSAALAIKCFEDFSHLLRMHTVAVKMLDNFWPLKMTLILISVTVHVCDGSSTQECSRSNSRVARDILQRDFYPILETSGQAVPPSCPLQPSRDMYLKQEERKRMENINRWYCNYCGKAFTSESFLDIHFSNRHKNAILATADAVCLADHCDYLRCDVVSGAKKASYWDKTLCRQSDLDTLKRQCEAVIKSCLPPALSGMDKLELRDKLRKAMCSPLTCDHYWEVPSLEMSPHGRVAYAVATCILIVGLMLYYLVAYTHFYTDNSLLNTDENGPLSNTEGDHYYMRNLYEHDIRYRNQQVPRR